MARRESSSQDIWTQAEALERAGRAKEAIDLYVRAAIAEEDARRPLRARLLWEQIGQRTGASGTLLERLARVSDRAHLDDDAFDYWVAAVARFHAEGRADDADRARGHALDLKRRLGDRTGTEREIPALARDVILSGESVVRDSARSRRMRVSFRIGAHELALKQGDITREEADAIVNAANSMLLGGGGVDGAIHRAAGPELLEMCRQVKKSLPGGLLRTGEAVATPAFKLKAQAVIHCVGPSYGQNGEGVWPMLTSCYERALALCRENSFQSIAFPSISTGAYGCPVGRASEVALTAIRDDLEAHGGPRLVTFVLFDVSTLRTYQAAAERLFSGGAASVPP